MQATKKQVSMKSTNTSVVNSAVLERLIKEVKQGDFVHGRYDKVHNRHNR